MSQHYDALETRDPQARERATLEQLRRQVAHAKAHATAYAERFADVDPATITTREAFARLPLTRKSELGERQKEIEAAAT